MTANETRDREIKGLLEAMDSYNLSEGIILTDDTEENLSVNGNRILIMPVYKWLLRI